MRAQAASDDGSERVCIEAAAETSDSDVALTDAEDAGAQPAACPVSAGTVFPSMLAAVAKTSSDKSHRVHSCRLLAL